MSINYVNQLLLTNHVNLGLVGAPVSNRDEKQKKTTHDGSSGSMPRLVVVVDIELSSPWCLGREKSQALELQDVWVKHGIFMADDGDLLPIIHSIVNL